MTAVRTRPEATVTQAVSVQGPGAEAMTRLIWIGLVGVPAVLVGIYGLLAPRTATLGSTPMLGDLSASALNSLQGLLSLVALAAGTLATVLAIPVPASSRSTRRGATAAASLAVLGATVVVSAWWNDLGFDVALLALPAMAVAMAVSPRPPVALVEGLLRWTMRGFVWGSLAAAFLAPDWATGPHESLIGLPSRLAGVTPHPNVLGFLAVAALVLEWSRRPRNAIAVALAFGAIVWTESKTAWAAVVVILLVGLLRRAGLATRTLALVVLSGSFGLTAMIAFTLAAPDRSTVKDENGADTFTGRTAIWEATLEVWQDQPVLGIGPRLWDEEMDRRFAGRVGFPPGHAHSQLVQTLGEAGVAGAASLVVALAALGGLAARAEARTRGATLGLFVLIVVSCFSEPRVRSNAYASGFFLVLGTLALGLAAAPEPSEALDG